MKPSEAHAARQLADADGLEWEELLPGTRQRYVIAARERTSASTSQTSEPNA